MPASRFARILGLAAASCAFTYLFFFEYLRPFKWVHIPYDLPTYHYSLADYAFRSLRSGRFPLWDPTMYCGLSFAGNIQAALFYPPTWLLFAANLPREHISYLSLEFFVIAHLWIAFLLCYRWLRRREMEPVAAMLGAGIYAFSGYACLQLQHLGLIAAYAWFPWGLEGIDDAAERKSWTPPFKLIAASTLAFLAGYPPTWLAFAVCAGSYAVFRSWNFRTIFRSALAMLASLAVAGIQLLPTLEASAAQFREPRYGTGIRDLPFYLSFLFPNYFNFGGNVPIFENPGKEYLYLGAPAFLGLALLWRYGSRKVIPFAAMGAVGLIFVVNPFDAVWTLIRNSSLLSEVCRSYYFLAAIPLAIAPAAACGLHGFLRRKTSPGPRWLSVILILAIAAYSTWQLRRWMHDDLPSGPQSIYDPIMTLALFVAALYVLRSQSGAMRIALAAAIVLLVGCDYKVFGTNKRFNADRGNFPPGYETLTLAGMNEQTAREIAAHPEYRILLDFPGAPFPVELRHVGLTTLQGFDPFFPAAYRQSLAGIGRFTSNMDFTIDENREDALHLYGVRYVITSPVSQFYRNLPANPNYRAVDHEDSWLRVFEYRRAHPPYGWETESQDSGVEIRQWAPEHRGFQVHSANGGRFTLREQFLPGWHARVDGQPVATEPWNFAFQSVQVPPGSHQVDFDFSSASVWKGAALSAASLLVLAALWFQSRQKS